MGTRNYNKMADYSLSDIINDIKKRMINQENYEIFKVVISTKQDSEGKSGEIFLLKDAPPKIKANNIVALIDKNYSTEELSGFINTIKNSSNNYALLILKTNDVFKSPSQKNLEVVSGLDTFNSEYVKNFIKLNTLERFLLELQDTTKNISGGLSTSNIPSYGFLTYYDPMAENDARIVTYNFAPVFNHGYLIRTPTDIFGWQKRIIHEKGLFVLSKENIGNSENYGRDSKWINNIDSTISNTTIVHPGNNGN